MDCIGDRSPRGWVRLVLRAWLSNLLTMIKNKRIRIILKVSDRLGIHTRGWDTANLKWIEIIKIIENLV